MMPAMSDPKPETKTSGDATVEPAPPGDAERASDPKPPARKREIGGPTGPEPTRYGDWERNGRVSDF
jgi:homeobox protein ESX1